VLDLIAQTAMPSMDVMREWGSFGLIVYLFIQLCRGAKWIASEAKTGIVSAFEKIVAEQASWRVVLHDNTEFLKKMHADHKALEIERSKKTQNLTDAVGRISDQMKG